ncbi:hypothetical protein IQ22_03086 [Pseudomonas duriflava]|uniref:Uncharacterized protein n=1 Tax=Pseudomonas duriflava TaxID=459528 RepID=A0A562Q959_9PSED|nr:hypothetical protein [Pseudomonas duriflava]TWI52710.1 hypothetical protein IQ22_03086 [Pseudomonas duriflava]
MSESARYASFTFLLDEAGQVHSLPHSLYVAMVHSEAAPIGLAGKRLRLVDWYVRLKDGCAEHVASEWYGWIHIDAEGCYHPSTLPNDPPAVLNSRNIDETALPTDEERERLELLVFGKTLSSTETTEERGPDGVPLDLYSG